MPLVEWLNADETVGIAVLACGCLVVWLLCKLLFAIMSYAKTAVHVLATSLLTQHSMTAKRPLAVNFKKSLSLLGIKDASDEDSDDGDNEHYGEVIKNLNGTTKSGCRRSSLSRPVHKDDDSEGSAEESMGSDGEGSALDALSCLVRDVLDTFAENLQASDEALDMRGMSELFGQLLDACDQRSAVTFSVVIARTGASAYVKTDEGKYSDVFQASTPSGTSVLKVVSVEYIARYTNQLWNHLLVARTLERLADKRASNYTTGFILNRSATCVWDGYPPELSSAYHSFAVVRRGTDRKSADIACGELDAQNHNAFRQVPQPYLVLQMDYAGVPLSSILPLSAGQALSVFKQVILTLAVAEIGIKFEHRHLSLDNVFVKRTEEQVIEWKLSGRAFHIETLGVITYIGNFGAARADTDGDVQFADPRPLWEDCQKDSALNDIHKRIREELNDDWSSYCPRTNVLFAYHVARELGHIRIAPEDPRRARDWDTFEAWKFRLPWFPSVAEFAQSVFTEMDSNDVSRKISSAVSVLGKLISKPLSPFLSGNN